MGLLYNTCMKQIKRIPVTKEGFENLKKELEKLKSERPQAVKTLAEARSMGDLSENGLYTAAKARLRSIDSQMFRLDIQIKLADIIEGGADGVVSIGKSVTVESEGSKTTFHIVGDYEANPLEKKISQHSPLGKVLMGKRVGDTVEFQAPKGSVAYKILSID